MGKTILMNYLLFIAVFQVCAQQKLDNTEIIDNGLMEHAEDLSKRILSIDCHTHSLFMNSSQAEQQQKTTFELLNSGWNIAIVQAIPTYHCEKGKTTDKIIYDIENAENEIISKKLPVTIIKNSYDFDKYKDQKGVKMILAAESSDYCEVDLGKLSVLYNQGIRKIVINNGNLDILYANGKLTNFGKLFINELNRLGIMCDISHLREEGEETKVALEIIELSKAPVIISHGAVYDLVPSNSNSHLEVLEEMISKGGMIGIRFYPDNLSLKAVEYLNQGKPRNGMPRASIEELIDQIDFIKEKFGIDCIGIGSDRLAIGYQPKGLETIEGNILIIYHMLRRGYTNEEIEKIMGLNFIRYWNKVERLRNFS